jgi:hypothetical protein
LSSALVVESNDALGRAAHVGDYKAETRIEFARMPFDLGDDAARFQPAPGLIDEICIGTPHFGWSYPAFAVAQQKITASQIGKGVPPNGIDPNQPAHELLYACASIHWPQQ